MRIPHCFSAILHGSLLGNGRQNLPRAAGRKPERAKLRRLARIRPTLLTMEKVVSEKALTIAGVGSIVAAASADYTRYL
jgi:hypothetical protein